MARASKTTTSTTINNHIFLFFILVTNLNPEQTRQFMSGFQYSDTAYTGSQPFPALSWAGSGLSEARSVCGPVGQSGWEAVRQG
jgi:hypothetical protein